MLPTQFREVTIEDLARAMRINTEWGLDVQGDEYLSRQDYTDLLALERV